MTFVRAALIQFFLTAAAHAQIAGGRLLPPSERVHPELVDSAWGPATRTAWEEAWNHHWKRAGAMFDSLYREHPDAVEARIGLGFVARGAGRYHEARKWFREALELDPGNQQVIGLLDIAQWDRPGRVEFVERATRLDNGQVRNSHGGGVILPLSTQLTATWRAGIFGAGDAFEQFFFQPVDSAGLGGNAHTTAAGAVLQASERYVVTAFWERWVANGITDEYVFADVADRMSDRYVVHLSTRQTTAGQPPTILSGALDYTVRRGQVLILRFAHATVSTPVEAQAQTRLIYVYIPPGHWVQRLGLVIDSDPRLAAQTVYASTYYYITPKIGLRADAIRRWGFTPQRAIQAGVVMLW